MESKPLPFMVYKRPDTQDWIHIRTEDESSLNNSKTESDTENKQNSDVCEFYTKHPSSILL